MKVHLWVAAVHEERLHGVQEEHHELQHLQSGEVPGVWVGEVPGVR